MSRPELRRHDARRLAALLVVTVAGLIAVAIVGKVAWDRYHADYVIERSDDGAAIAKVVAARFAGASALKVGGLTGTVQATASDVRGFGMLHSDKVVKAPFSVDYFLDLSKLGASDVRFDAASRTLVVDVPDVTVGQANVDEAARTVSETRGLVVTRDAADRLAQIVSQRAQATAAAEARKPAQLALARDNARKALGRLLAAPLAAAGQDDVRVVLAFPFERNAQAEEWDRSRRVDEVLSNR